ncbi:MAG: glucose 1-dehydrogenase [Chloroflexi bacterium]|nr:glucose 1-dehydrogenase [Chloroflexota bacterium]
MAGRIREVQPGYVDGLFSLQDRVCIVAGGGSGLGEAIATGFAQAGARVIAADIRTETVEELATLVTETRHPIVARALDVTQKSSVDAFVASVVDEFGAIDVLCTSAGTAARHPAEDYPEEIYDRIISLNLKGSFLMAQAVGRTMLAKGSGSIINIASIGGSIAYPGSTAYNQSKGGVVQMTRSLALEWASRGVRVNAIAPSLFNTPLVRANEHVASYTSDFIMQRTPMGRKGEPHEVVGAAIFLASDASSMVTGTILGVDGGYLTA